MSYSMIIFYFVVIIYMLYLNTYVIYIVKIISREKLYYLVYVFLSFKSYKINERNWVIINLILKNLKDLNLKV